MAQESKSSVLGHLDELRKRLMWVVIAVAIGIGVSFYFAADIIELLKGTVDEVELQAISPTERIGTFFKLSLYCALAGTTPIILYHIVMFLRPALKPSERRYLYTLLPCVLLSFVAGVAFAYFILIPPAVRFLWDFGSGTADSVWRISDYVTLMVRLLFAIGICFETPIVIYFLTKIGLLTPKKLARFRRFAIVAAFIIAGIITPTFDPVNQTLVAIPLIVLYEVGIVLSKIAVRGKKEEGTTDGIFKG